MRTHRLSSTDQPHVPPSWSEAGSGLVHSLDEGSIQREIKILHRTMCGLNSGRERRSLGDDLSTIYSMCSKVDFSGNFANLQRVQCAGASLWTTPNGVKQIQDGCDKFDFRQAIKIQTDLEMKLKSQEQIIKQLRDKVERMTWHEELNLNVPQTENEKQKLTSARSEKIGRPLPNIAVVAEKSLNKNDVNEAARRVGSSGAESINAEKNGAAELESVTTANSKPSFRDEVSVD